MLRPLPVLLALIALAGCREQRALLGHALSGKPPVTAGSLAGEWQIADLNGGGTVARGQLRFDGDRVAGTVGCNRFGGGWRQDGQTISFGQMMSTRMACPPPLMDIEMRVTALLQAANAVSFTDDGAAVISAPGGRRLTLRRAAAAQP